MKKILLVILLLAVCLPAWCQAAFQVIPPRNVIAGNKFMVKFKVVNGESGAPQAPSISGCKLLSPTPGRSTMQSFQMINGQSSSSTSVEYTFVYRAEKRAHIPSRQCRSLSTARNCRPRPLSLLCFLPTKARRSHRLPGRGGADMTPLPTTCLLTTFPLRPPTKDWQG